MDKILRQYHVVKPKHSKKDKKSDNVNETLTVVSGNISDSESSDYIGGINEYFQKVYLGTINPAIDKRTGNNNNNDDTKSMAKSDVKTELKILSSVNNLQPVWYTNIQLPSIEEHKKIESMIVKEFEMQMSSILNEIKDTKVPKSGDWIKIFEIVYFGIQLLYCKYIESNTAPLEINISSPLRLQMTQLFVSENVMNVKQEIQNIIQSVDETQQQQNDMDATVLKVNQLIDFITKYWDGMKSCSNQISMLMNDSFSRFNKTEIGKNVIKQYGLRGSDNDPR